MEPLLITSDNFARAEIGDALHDARQMKVFLFTVQTLISPTVKASRKAYEDNENIGDALYSYLQSAHDLVVIVDEHHVIREKAKRFNAAVMALIEIPQSCSEFLRSRGQVSAGSCRS